MGYCLRMEKDLALIEGEMFINLCRLKPQSFTRRRKMPANLLVESIIARKGRTLKMELREFSKSTKTEQISIPGYLKAREKLNPQALKQLALHHASNIYSDGDFKTCNGFLPIAIDGTKANVPTNTETIDLYGNTSGKGKAQAMMGLSCAYDVANRQIVDLTINRGGFNERAQVPTHVETIRNTVEKNPFVVVMDRGYTSFAVMAWLEDNNIPYLMRCQKGFMNAEFCKMQHTDYDVTVEVNFTNVRLLNIKRHNEQSYNKLLNHASLKVRCLLVDIGSGTPEKLITNIAPDTMTFEEIADLYHARWGVETCFQMLKDRLQMENMTGTKPILIEQDVYASAYLLNAAFDLANEADAVVKMRDNPYKHEMTVNKGFAIGVLKDELIQLIMAPISERQKRLASIVEELSRNLVPIRKNRSYSREGTKHRRHNIYSNTHKRVF